ncbi:MAG: hypothetical protein ACD_9C00313G0011 [uncultured bacterium]|nr:MAG: hypothetical protein ACD_9C00313G0011 [uncultured bacterium]
MMKNTGFSAIVNEIDLLARNSRIMSAVGYAIALERTLDCFPREYIEKTFYYLFISQEVWEKCKIVFVFGNNINTGNAYHEYINHKGKAWFNEAFDKVFDDSSGYVKNMWNVFCSCGSSDKLSRVTLLYFVIDAIRDSEQDEFVFEVDNLIVGQAASTQQNIFIN